MPLQLGPALRTLRTEKNVSMLDLHRRTGIARSHLYRLEDGETTNPKREYLNRIAMALDIEPEDLYDLAWANADQQSETPPLPPLPQLDIYLRHKYNFTSSQIAAMDRAFKQVVTSPPRTKQPKGGPTKNKLPN